MKIEKRQSKKTYTGADKKERHYYNYYVILDNGKYIAVKCVNKEDYRVLDAVCYYVSCK